MQKRINNAELLKHYQTEAEENRTRKQNEKANKITAEKEHMQNINDQLELERQSRLQSKISSINAQKEDYERYLTEKNIRQKSGDYRKKTSEPQGTFKIGGDNREIRRKNKDDFEYDLPQNPTRNNQITTPNANQRENNHYANLPSNANIVQMNKNRNQGYNIISGQTSDSNSQYENRRNLNDYNNNYANYNTNPITHANVNTNQAQQNMSNDPNLPKINNRNLQTKANKASYNPISHTDNTNYYSNNPNANQRNNNSEQNENFNRNKNNYNYDYDYNYDKKPNAKEQGNVRGNNLKYEDEYENVVTRNANERLESEGNAYDEAENRYKNLSEVEKRRLYEEYMRNLENKQETNEDQYDRYDVNKFYF